MQDKTTLMDLREKADKLVKVIDNGYAEKDWIFLDRLLSLNLTLAKEIEETKFCITPLPKTILGVEYGSAKIGDKVYKTVKIGKQTWLAENLNYKIRVEGYNPEELPQAWYYNDDEEKYGKYGLLYNWYGAMKAAEEIEGWHLPTLDEWNELAKATGGFEKCADNLKDPEEWEDDDLKNEFGFSAFPAGFRITNGSFGNVGSYALFWSATDYSSSNAYHRYFDKSASMNSSYLNKAIAFSVRLVQDS